ncbi:hypothetical protein LOK49_LG09G02504 [Camellia lanceoleosa]|uniref:Uncharacterized protein n=1 Tax=Camellia lanceoleosa TaxID=1840588 RepID=A0ACC0GJ54_9ERIC|nr:hypothetical protein LOK49_LG09G02504 [Camellia lanceoleosa]
MAAQQDPTRGSINVVVEYKIEDSTDNSIRHGWVKIQDMKVERSFLGFENENEAKRVHKNLSKLQGVSFLKSYFIIKHQEHYWLAVDKIQYSLEKYKKEHSRIWNGSRLVSQYQDIIRGIIIGMCELHGQRYTHGSLSIKDILIVNDKPKFAFIRNEFLEGDNECPIHKENLGQDFEDLKILFKKVIGTYPGNEELNHFYERAEVNNALSLSKLYFHPILMAPMERFFQPVRMDTLERYPDHEKASNARDHPTNDWIKEVKEYYENIKTYAEEKKRPYRLNVWDLFKFVRNAIVHINEYTKSKTEEDVEKELSTMFPDSFNEIYDLFDLKEIASGSRATHLESPTKDGQKRRTHQQSSGRPPKRTRLDHNLNPSKSEPPSSSRHCQSSQRRSHCQSSSSGHSQSSSSRYQTRRPR